MSELRASPGAIRGLMTAMWLVFLAGCIPQPMVLPAAIPSALTATPGNAVVTLAWTTSTYATSYRLKRATTAGGPYTQLAESTSNAYTDSSVTNGTTYYYVVSALSEGGESGNSPEASATPAVLTTPQPPTNLTATAGDAQVGLSWLASATAATYRVKRATTSGGPYASVAVVATNSHVDTGLTNNTTYYYVVTAINAAGESANSAQVSAVPSPPPPTNFGTWVNVTPSNVNLTDDLCGNGGIRSMQADAAHPSNVYFQANCQGVWKSTDYGNTWTGPINTGTNGAATRDCAGGITISPTSTAAVPTIYQSCIRGGALGFWKSVDGGVSWTRYNVGPSGQRQDYFPPVVDPYDPNHLLMTGHEFGPGDSFTVVESIDGGQTWSNVPIASGMVQNGLSGFIFFVNTGSSTTTRRTWLWLGEQNGGGTGTWRTSNSGTNWVRVDQQEHLLGSAQIYQPDNNGVVYIAGANSPLGSGVLRSSDYGQTWTHVGLFGTANLMFGTAKNVYALGLGVFELAFQPGTGTWVTPGNTPLAVIQDPQQVGVLNNGTSNIILGALARSGVWRYVEP